MGDSELNDSFTNSYRDPGRISALGGRKNFLASVKSDAVHKADSWLMGEDSYTLHKPVRINFKRRKTITSGPGNQIQADLLDVHSLADSNDGVTFLMTLIDIFSKKAWIIPLKRKTGVAVANGLRTISPQLKGYQLLQTDKGKEFVNKDVRSLLKEMEINHFTTENETIKAGIVERFNRTIRNKIYRHLTVTKASHFLSVLPQMVDTYNLTVHTSTGLKPKAVNSSNQADVWNRLYEPDALPLMRKSSLKPLDYVRISTARTAFERGYTPNWSREIFIIKSVLEHTNPVVYTLLDYEGEPVIGTFYEKELQKVAKPETFDIEEIVETKGRGLRKKYLVKWKGYPSSANSWITDADMI